MICDSNQVSDMKQQEGTGAGERQRGAARTGAGEQQLRPTHLGDSRVVVIPRLRLAPHFDLQGSRPAGRWQREHLAES